MDYDPLNFDNAVSGRKSMQGKSITPARANFIKLLARIAVEEYLDELSHRKDAPNEKK
jgi:hypothetical protein